MTLILAVEPDPRQASRLSSVLRGRRNTQVVVSKAADAAIEAMAGRVPDVLLTSPLLSPQDELRLADWLKELGPSAAHVQTLTIPILARTGPREEQTRGLLGGLRGRKQKSIVQGCEPKIFAEHVATYLDQAIAERMDDVVTPPAAVPAPEPEAVPEPVIMSAPELNAEESWGPDLTAELEAEESCAAEPEVLPEPEVQAVPADNEGAWLLSRSPQVVQVSEKPVADEPDTVPMMRLPQPQVLTLPREVVPVAPLEVVFVPPEVITIREDTCQKLVLPQPAPKPASPTTRRKKKELVQDEWGLFDPSKCGFAALLEKLDEITEEERQTHKEAETSVRLITHY